MLTHPSIIGIAATLHIADFNFYTLIRNLIKDKMNFGGIFCFNSNHVWGIMNSQDPTMCYFALSNQYGVIH